MGRAFHIGQERLVALLLPLLVRKPILLRFVRMSHVFPIAAKMFPIAILSRQGNPLLSVLPPGEVLPPAAKKQLHGRGRRMPPEAHGVLPEGRG